MRSVHEKLFHEQSCFLTLTYRDESLPPGRTLVRRDFTLFMKRFREYIDVPIRNVYCGEYGSKTGRPHFHAIIFGYDFKFRDKSVSLHKYNKLGQCLWKSPLLNDLWGKGFCLSGEVTWQSAAYTARYIMKKVKGEKAEEHYWNRDPETGEKVNKILPEFFQPSTRYGIGTEYIWNYWREVYADDFVVVDGRKYRPPRFYDKFLQKQDPELYEKVKAKRRERAQSSAKDNTWARLEAREKVKMSQFNQLVRDLE